MDLLPLETPPVLEDPKGDAPLVEVHRLEKAWTGLRQIPGKAKAASRSICTSLIPVDTRY